MASWMDGWMALLKLSNQFLLPVKSGKRIERTHIFNASVGWLALGGRADLVEQK